MVGVAVLGLPVGAGLAGALFFGAAFAGATGGFFLLAAVSAGRDFAAMVLAFGAVLDCFGAGRAGLAAGADFFGVALRTGAFSAAERFGLGCGRADLTLTLRLAEDFEEALLGAGREVFLFAPLITGSLMRSTQVFTDSP